MLFWFDDYCVSNSDKTSLRSTVGFDHECHDVGSVKLSLVCLQGNLVWLCLWIKLDY